MQHWFIYQNDNLLFIKQGEQLLLPTKASLAKLAQPFLREYALGEVQQQSSYCAEIDKAAMLPPSFIAIPLRKAFEILGMTWYSTAVKSFSIIHWDKTHQFCGRCGQPTTRNPNLFERICTTCKQTFYPRISPSVIVRIAKGDHILMARGPHFVPGAYGLIAGFVEVGENVEQTIHREVKEEVGIKIKNLRYFGSQPWPFPDSLMLAFTADYASGELCIDQREIEAAGWYRYDNLPGRPSSSISLANELINHFVVEQGGSHGNI